MKLKKTALFYFVIALSFTACTPKGNSPGETKASSKINILYNNDLFGYLDPCGCRVTPIGGMFRRYNAFSKIDAAKRIFVDSGSLLYGTSSVPSIMHEEAFEQAKAVVEAYNLLKADVVGLAETDFALGKKKLMEIMKLANFEFISSNIYSRVTGRRFIKGNTVIERAGYRIGVFSLYHSSTELSDGLKVRDPIMEARDQVESLKNKNVDMIIALTNQGLKKDEQMIEKIDGIDLLVGGHSQSLLQSPRSHKNTRIVQLSSRGQVFGRISYNFARNEKPKEISAEVRDLDSDFDKVPSGVENPMNTLIATMQLKIKNIAKKAEDKLWKDSKKMPDLKF